MAKPRIMYFNDDRHSLAYMYEPPMQKEEWESAVDELVGTPVEALMYCLGDGRTVMHDSEAAELLGENQDRWENLVVRRAHQNPKHLIEEGNDPLRITIEHAHSNGLLLYPMLIVQFGMSSHPERVSTFRLENRHLEIGASEDIGPDYPGAEYLDFKHQEVRDERFALIEETVNKYEVDGFQLNLGSYPYYFHPNEIEEGRKTMTEWVRRVYELLKESGPDRELVIDVPVSIEGSFSVGLDVREWINQGIVDVLVGAVQTFRGLADYRPLVEAARGSDCRIHAAVGSTVDSDRLHDATIEMMRAEVTNYWAQGIDGVYVSGWTDRWPLDAPFYEMMRELPYPHIMAPKDKYYYVPTILGRFGLPDPGPGLALQLPLDLEVNVPATVDFEIGDDLPRWDRVGRVHEVLLRVRVENTTEIERLRFRLNGKELPDTLLRKINEIYRMAAPRYRTGSCYWFVFKLDRDHWPRQGDNALEMTLLNRDPEVVHQISIRDVELETKYLMGKSFHRGFMDPDLGQYEGRSS